MYITDAGWCVYFCAKFAFKLLIMLLSTAQLIMLKLIMFSNYKYAGTIGSCLQVCDRYVYAYIQLDTSYLCNFNLLYVAF